MRATWETDAGDLPRLMSELTVSLGNLVSSYFKSKVKRGPRIQLSGRALVQHAPGSVLSTRKRREGEGGESIGEGGEGEKEGKREKGLS